ncbi:GAF domain-containing protein [Ramlibacter sp. PS3R-8]|uniref:GAF domain-containing protein n=1 Tax=Ramlibacter sp. PS3R-8 TaxID=3133437 RepID=UPI003095B5EE
MPLNSPATDQMHEGDTQLRDSLEQGLRRAWQMVDARQPLRLVLAQLTSIAESLSPDSVCSILVLDSEGLLRNGASPNLPADYLDAIDRLKPDPLVGTCAAAAATGEIVVTPDFRADTRWAELRHLPLALGYHSAWSQPIKSADGRVLGTFGTYFRSRREPTPQERETVALLARVAANALTAPA